MLLFVIRRPGKASCPESHREAGTFSQGHEKLKTELPQASERFYKGTGQGLNFKKNCTAYKI
jgi:hypothetical protein